MADPAVIHRLAQDLLGCVCAALNDTAAQTGDARVGCPCRSCLVPGAAVADDCCDTCGSDTARGTLNVAVDRLYPVDPFPEPLRPSRWSECKLDALDIAVDLTVTLFRCTPTLDPMGRPPSCDDLEDAAWRQHVDGWAIWQGVSCCLGTPPPGRRRPRRFMMQPLAAIAPTGNVGGGCQGWQQKVTVALGAHCVCPPAGSPA